VKILAEMIIENFGPIKNCTLEVKKFHVFIGPQASGKSTISKSIFFFKSLRDDLIKLIFSAFENGALENPFVNYKKIIRKKFLDFWGPTYHLDDIHLKYIFSENVYIEIRLEQPHKYIDPSFSRSFLSGFNKIIRESQKYIELINSKNKTFLSSREILVIESEKRVYFRNIEVLVNDLFADSKDMYFIPAGRSLVATLSDQLQLIQAHSLDYLTRSFIDRINITKNMFSKSLKDIVLEKKLTTQDKIMKDATDLAENIINRILKGSYRYDRDGEKIFINDNKYVKINHSSSGQQESIWILLLVFLLILENRSVFIVVEEPEAHLFPEAQKDIVELISLLFNTQDNQIILTTHSPYILSSINNLLYAYKVGNNRLEQVSKLINQKVWISPSELSVYFINNGIYEDIMDHELDLIKVEKIDAISSVLNEQYEDLFDLED
jgi:predicted ATPase